jgi:predicted GTPase
MLARAIADGLSAWYQERARPVLEKLAPERLKEFDENSAVVRRLLEAADEAEVAVCFLGAAGVGKSTLLNALVAEQQNILPHGGIGSLTAQATIVRQAEQPYLRVEYFQPTTLRGILLLLEKSHAGDNKRSIPSDDVGAELSDEDLRDVEAGLPNMVEDGDAEPAVSEKVVAYQRQVRLMIQGDQRGEIDTPYLLDGLRDVLGLRPRWDRRLEPADAARARKLRESLSLAASSGGVRELKQSELGQQGFLQEIREHSSGFMAPVIRKLELGWDAEILRDDLVLVDLPGIGVANDEYRRVTHEWIAQRARAIVLVVGARGVTESDADLLRRTGFFNRLLHDGDDPTAPPVTLAVAVVYVDEAATAAWLSERERDRATARKWPLHFAEACERAVDMVRGQVAQELQKLGASGGDATRPEREAAMARVLSTLQVHPVSAPQFRAFHVADEENPARIASAEQSRVPGLAHALRELARDHRRRHTERIRTAIENFADPIRTQLALDRASWEQDTRAEQEAEGLRAELEAFLLPRRRELEARQGAFREFLNNGIPEQIDARVAEAALNARVDIARFLGRMNNTHWATLKATVRKGGAHTSGSGTHLDLANELTLRFEEPVAVVWSKYILSSLRKRTGELGADYVQIVGEVVDWARGQDARVSRRVVEKLHESLVADTKGLNAVGKEAVDELKKKVRDQLYSKLVDRVRACCDAFIQRRAHEGPGVKQRILEFFKDELAQDVTEIAQPAAKKILLRNYTEVRTEILERFDAYKNPIDRARDALVVSHEEGVRRSDAQKRRKVLGEIDGALASMPAVSA